MEFTHWPGTPWLLLIAGLAAAAIFASYYWAKGRASRWSRFSLGAIRWIVLATVVLCWLGPEWVDAIKRQPKSRVAVLLDSSRSMSIKDLPEERLSSAKVWLRQELGPLVPPQVHIDHYTFQDALAPAPQLDSVMPGGEATGLVGSLESLLSVASPDPLAAVVVCSDGIENQRHDAEMIARTYRRKGIPIHTLTLGTTNDARDVVVDNVQVRRAVPNQAPTRVTVALRATGYADQTVPVQILHEDAVVAVKDVRLTGQPQRVEVDFTPRQKGFQVYETRVPAQREEWLTTNNRRLFGLEVIDPTIRVLYMEGTPQQPDSLLPEWGYLKNALEADPNIRVTTLYREFGASGKRLNAVDTDPTTGERIYPVEHPTRGLPRTLSQLLEYDVVIHSDIRKESFTSEQLRNIQRLVEDFGGGFVMIGGNSAFGKGGYHRTILDRVIPVAMQQADDSQARPFKMQVSPSAWLHPVIALGANRAQTELIWTQKFPLLYGCNLVGRAKPGATVLGLDPSATTARGARLILAVQNVGRGRSMAFTSDTTRTWGKDFETLWGEKLNPGLPLTEENCDSRYYRQFWVNAVRWLAAARVGRTNNPVNLELAQSYGQPNERVAAFVTVRDASLRELTTADVSILIATKGQTNLAGKAAFDVKRRAYVAEVVLPAAGEFTVSAVASVRGAKIGDDRQLLVCEGTDREISDLRARPDLMAGLAHLSGGKVLALGGSDMAALSAVFDNAPPATVEYRRSPAWDRSWILAAILGLLTVEWATRRLLGLA